MFWAQRYTADYFIDKRATARQSYGTRRASARYCVVEAYTQAQAARYCYSARCRIAASVVDGWQRDGASGACYKERRDYTRDAGGFTIFHRRH